MKNDNCPEIIVAPTMKQVYKAAMLDLMSDYYNHRVEIYNGEWTGKWSDTEKLIPIGGMIRVGDEAYVDYNGKCIRVRG
jgi:hypothetical protein